jgi:hypothetical protein
MKIQYRRWQLLSFLSQVYLCHLCGCRMQYLETTENTGAIIFDRVYVVRKSLPSPCFPFVAADTYVCVFESRQAGKQYKCCRMQITVGTSSVRSCSGQVFSIATTKLQALTIVDSFRSDFYVV